MKGRPAIFLGVASLIAFAAFAGSYHVVSGSTFGEPRLLPRVSFSFAEFFVNSDAVGRMPAIAARAQYPLFLLALEQEASRMVIEEVTRQAKIREANRKFYALTESDIFKVRQGMKKNIVKEILGGLGELEQIDLDKRPGVVIEVFRYYNKDGSRAEIIYHNDVVERTAFHRSEGQR